MAINPKDRVPPSKTTTTRSRYDPRGGGIGLWVAIIIAIVAIIILLVVLLWLFGTFNEAPETVPEAVVVPPA